MKFYLIFLTLFYITANAQVNLDKSFNGKSGNTLFYDLNDANVVWAIPKYLEATSANDILEIGSEYRVRYTVGLPLKTLGDLIPEPGSTLTFRAFRATQAALEQMSDIDPKLKPVITALGDIGMFGESIPYNVSISKLHYPNTARHAAYHYFDGKHAYIVGRILYHFSAARSGQLFQAQSTIAILTAKKKSLPMMFSENLGGNGVGTMDTVLDETYTPQILYNSLSGCWGKSIENAICLKDQ